MTVRLCPRAPGFIPQDSALLGSLRRPGAEALKTSEHLRAFSNDPMSNEVRATKAAVPTAPKKASGSHFYRYSEFSETRREWLREIILEHKLYVPTLPELNDPADGRPKLARLSDDQMFHFLYDGPFGVLKRNPRMSV